MSRRKFFVHKPESTVDFSYVERGEKCSSFMGFDMDLVMGDVKFDAPMVAQIIEGDSFDDQYVGMMVFVPDVPKKGETLNTYEKTVVPMSPMCFENDE